MLLMLEKCIRGRIFHVIYRYTKANNKYMKNYDKYKDSLCGWALSQKLSVDGFK